MDGGGLVGVEDSDVSNPVTEVTASIDAENDFTDPIVSLGREIQLSISGTFSATVWLQRRLNSAPWLDVTSYTAAAEKIIDTEAVGVEYRLGVKTGGYASGTAVCLLKT